MKDTKKIKSKIAYFLTIVFLLPTAFSCTQSESDIEKNQFSDYKEIEKKYEGSALKIAQGLKELNAKFQSQTNNQFQNRIINGIEVTQELLDDYANSIGFEEGIVSLELFNAVINDYDDLINNGLDHVLDTKPLVGLTKDKMKDINDNRINIQNLYSLDGFVELPSLEKEHLIFLNTLALDSFSLNDTQQSRFWDGFTSGMVGATAGMLAFGPAGAFAGFFIGMFVHSLAKN